MAHAGFVPPTEQTGRRAMDGLAQSLRSLEFGPPVIREITLIACEWKFATKKKTDKVRRHFGRNDSMRFPVRRQKE